MVSADLEYASAIIVAAGRGLRMKTAVPKQYVSLAGGSVLGHTIVRFDRCPQIDRIVLVIPESDYDFCRREILTPLQLQKPLTLAPGGPSRQASVSNGLQMLPESDALVLVHDGVRPLVTGELIIACIAEAARTGACVPAVPVDDTLKRVDPDGWIAAGVDRENLWRVQTPQGFRLDLLRRAHRTAARQQIQGTDDGSLVERLGHPVRMIPGSKHNIKLTTAEDLQFAEALLRFEPQIFERPESRRK